MRSEHADLALIADEERARLQREMSKLLPYADLYARQTAIEPDDAELRPRLERAIADLPARLPRSVLVKIRRCVARFGRLERLRGPVIIICNEAKLLSRILDWRRIEEIAPVELDPDRGFESMFGWALDACVVKCYEKGRGRDIGLGFGIRQSNLVQVRSLERLRHQYPFVPHGRFLRAKRGSLCDAFEGTGPMGWAAGEDLSDLSRAVRDFPNRNPAFMPQLRAFAERLEQAERDGHAVVGWFEEVPKEAEGHRIWLVDGTDGEEE
ncbi:MAG: hypothetical protein HOW73_32525 [Polyangiaceae bacterium]|nr:hypothetical protein [Polyangiaceae bacterium]